MWRPNILADRPECCGTICLLTVKMPMLWLGLWLICLYLLSLFTFNKNWHEAQGLMWQHAYLRWLFSAVLVKIGGIIQIQWCDWCQWKVLQGYNFYMAGLWSQSLTNSINFSNSQTFHKCHLIKFVMLQVPPMPRSRSKQIKLKQSTKPGLNNDLKQT